MQKKIFFTLITLGIPLWAKDLAVFKVANVPAKALYITQPALEKDRLFVLNQKGQIHIIKNGKTLNEPFLDISDRVHGSLTPGSEEGMLGLAFHPEYKENGYFYVNYVDRNDTSIVSRFSVTHHPETADKNSEKILLKLAQPFGNHNGGHLAFGPRDGMLYIGFGDGGKWGDPYDNAQNLNTLLGAILRIDVNSGDPYSIPVDNPFNGQKDKRPEIFCYGLRNPWRFSFDRETNDLIIGDVGQNLWEEISWTTWDVSKGANYGWRTMEANHCYNPEEFCDTTGLVMPVHEYPNNAAYMKILMGMDNSEATGCSVTGGYVYRGADNPHLWGTYIFGDYCTGKIWSIKNYNSIDYEIIDWTKDLMCNKSQLYISSFGKDENGELYIIDHAGSIYKIIKERE